MSTLKAPVSSSDHIKGNPKAAVTLVEYGDYQCPFCRIAHGVVKQVQDFFGDQLCFVFRHFPLTEIHPQAEVAAEAAEFAGAHKRFWEMHDLIYENQELLSLPLFFELAKALKLPAAELKEALENGTYQAKIRADFTSGVRSGVNGTPTFFINGQRHDGSYEYEELVAAIQQAATK